MRGYFPVFLGLVACGTDATIPDVAVDPTVPAAPPSPSSPAQPTATPAPPAPETACAGKSGASGDRTITVSGHTIELHVPAGYDAAKATPLVLAFHGYMMASAEMRSTTHLDAAADKNGFVVAFPNGKNQSWNGGDCCGDAESSDEDDVALARAIVTAIRNDYCIDDKRTFATGFSNGAFLAYRLACEAADVFASIASVSGSLGIEPATCKPSRVVPVLEIHGTSDIVVPYKGGRSVFLGPEYRSVDTTMKTWVDRDACSTTKKSVFAEGDVTCESYEPCSATADVQLCTVSGGGHAWPGGSGSNGSSDVWKATDAVVSFLLAHPM